MIDKCAKERYEEHFSPCSGFMMYWLDQEALISDSTGGNIRYNLTVKKSYINQLSDYREWENRPYIANLRSQAVATMSLWGTSWLKVQQSWDYGISFNMENMIKWEFPWLLHLVAKVLPMTTLQHISHDFCALPKSATSSTCLFIGV